MNIPCLAKSCTIRARLVLLNGITMFLVCILVSIYTFQLITEENNLVTMEQVDDLFSSILGLRRYEKNIMLQLDDDDNVSKAGQSLREIESHLQQLTSAIKTEEGRELFQQLEKSFIDYQTVYGRWCGTQECRGKNGNKGDTFLIREYGQGLVENAARLAKYSRKVVSSRFKNILFWLTFLPALIFTIGGILFFSQTKNILNRLASVKQATKSLAAGEFKPIPTINSSDEITELIENFNQMVEALDQKQEQLIQSRKMASIGTFSSGIAHEINNPLNNISLSTDTLLEEIGAMGEEETKEILDDIMTQTERASNIVRNLLDFSRTHSSDTQPLYIDYVIHKTTDLIANELKIHKIALKKDLIDVMPQVMGDLQQLQQVFINLIINAEQAIQEEGSITVKSRPTDDNSYIRTDIIDSGPGITQKDLEQIFDPFFTTKEAGKGTGLGLSIVYGIVKKHGGFVEVASKLGQGTTFSVYLPIYCDVDETESPEEV